jgi:hypothetical protein
MAAGKTHRLAFALYGRRAGRDILEDRVLPRVAKLADHTIKGLSAPPRSGSRSARSFLDTL